MENYGMIFRNLLFAAGMLASAASSAATFNYTAINIDDDSVLSGTFGWNPVGAVDTNPSADRGEYAGAGFWTGTITCGTCTLNGTNFAFDPMKVEIYDNLNIAGNTSDELYMTTSDYLDGSYIDIMDLFGDWFSGDALPTSLPEMGSFQFARMFLGSEIVDPGNYLQYDLTEVSAVPVPPAIWLFGSALAGFVGWSRRRQNA
jgi:hypothetical protein